MSEQPDPLLRAMVDDGIVALTALSQAIDTADHVHHGTLGETWVVACVQGDRLSWCGWPEGTANVSDCTLVRKATSEERDKLLRELAAMNGSDHRGVYARRRLGMPRG